MPSKYGNDSFYKSKAWLRVSAAYMSSKSYICERCGKPAVICHHKKWLNGSNVHDPSVALSFDNLEALCMDCHNKEHSAKHDTPVFDAAGNMIRTKESVDTREFKTQRAQIDDVVERAKSLLCGLKKNDVTEAP